MISEQSKDDSSISNHSNQMLFSNNSDLKNNNKNRVHSEIDEIEEHENEANKIEEEEKIGSVKVSKDSLDQRLNK